MNPEFELLSSFVRSILNFRSSSDTSYRSLSSSLASLEDSKSLSRSEDE